MGDNVCCPHFIVLDCTDTDEHKHIACAGSLDDSPAIDNDTAIKRCLGDFENCLLKPRGENL